MLQKTPVSLLIYIYLLEVIIAEQEEQWVNNGQETGFVLYY